MTVLVSKKKAVQKMVTVLTKTISLVQSLKEKSLSNYTIHGYIGPSDSIESSLDAKPHKLKRLFRSFSCIDI